jgi:hypothetical protein
MNISSFFYLPHILPHPFRKGVVPPSYLPPDPPHSPLGRLLLTLCSRGAPGGAKDPPKDPQRIVFQHFFRDRFVDVFLIPFWSAVWSMLALFLDHVGDFFAPAWSLFVKMRISWIYNDS